MGWVAAEIEEKRGRKKKEERKGKRKKLKGRGLVCGLRGEKNG